MQVPHDEDGPDTDEKDQSGEGQGRAEKELLEAIQLPAYKGHGNRLCYRFQHDTAVNFGL